MERTILPSKGKKAQNCSNSLQNDHLPIVSSKVSNPSTNNEHFGRERLKKHREDVAGRVIIPETWGQENLLKEWKDFSSFDRMLAPDGLGSARQALVAQSRARQSIVDSTIQNV